jgi:hypothetical protein
MSQVREEKHREKTEKKASTYRICSSWLEVIEESCLEAMFAKMPNRLRSWKRRRDWRGLVNE